MADSIYRKTNLGVYIIDFDVYMQSGGLVTLLTRRYVEIKMFPRPFMEFLKIIKLKKLQRFAEHLRNGGLSLWNVSQRRLYLFIGNLQYNRDVLIK